MSFIAEDTLALKLNKCSLLKSALSSLLRSLSCVLEEAFYSYSVPLHPSVENNVILHKITGIKSFSAKHENYIIDTG